MTAEALAEITSITDTLLGNESIIQIFTQDDYVQILETATVMEVEPKPDKDLMDQPIESGATITDFVVTKPKELDLAVILADVNYLADYLQVKQLFENNTFLIVQTAVDSYENLIIKSMPHKENGEMSQAIRMVLALREVLKVTPAYAPIPAQPQAQNTTNRGEVQPKSTSNNQSEDASDLYKAFN
jgi:hypothetical protein